MLFTILIKEKENNEIAIVFVDNCFSFPYNEYMNNHSYNRGDRMTEQEIKQVKKQLYSKRELDVLATFFKVFGDTTRLRIINVLQQKAMCVSEIAKVLDMTPSSISHQLRSLRTMNLVITLKKGKTVYYKLSDYHILDIFGKGYEHIQERGRYDERI